MARIVRAQHGLLQYADAFIIRGLSEFQTILDMKESDNPRPSTNEKKREARHLDKTNTQIHSKTYSIAPYSVLVPRNGPKHHNILQEHKLPLYFEGFPCPA